MNNFCGNCGAQLVNGSCPYCNGNNVVNQQQMSNQQFQNNVNMNQNMGMSNQPVMGGVENLNLNGNSNVNNGSITNNTSASNKGIIGLVLGIVAFFIFGFLAFIGLALSITGLNEAKSSGGAGKGVCIAGIVVCGIDSVLLVLGWIMKLLSLGA